MQTTIISAISKQIQDLASPTVTKYYKLEGTIGKGSSSLVKRATNRQTGEEVAVKVVNVDKFKACNKGRDHIDREIRIMKLIDHAHCVKLFDVYQTSNQIYLVLEMMSGGELFDRIISKEYYSESEAANCFVQIMSAVEYLHGLGVVHRDIKPENVLYATTADNSPVKIADFGFGRLLSFEGEVMKTMCGTPTFIAPEVIAARVRPGGPGASDGYDKACDVWSAGVLLFCLLSGEHPFDQDALVSELFRQITQGAYTFRPEIWDEISGEAKDLVRSMMTVDPRRRATAAECLAHPWCAAQREGRVPSKALTQAQMKLRDRHEALARRKLLGHAAPLAGGVGAGPGGGAAIGCLLARGEELEILSINAYGKQLLACAAEPDPAPRRVRDLLDPRFTAIHARYMAKAFLDGSLPKSIQHPLRSVTMYRRDGSTVQCELLVGKLDESQAFEDEAQAFFFGYFVPTAQSATGGKATLQEKMRAAYGDGYAARLLSGEARPPPEHYDEVTVACFAPFAPAAPAHEGPPAGGGGDLGGGGGEAGREAAAGGLTVETLGAIAERHRVHVLPGDGDRMLFLAGTNHVAHDLSFDQTERTVQFVSEVVAAAGPERRFGVGVATGPASVAVEVLAHAAAAGPDAGEWCRYKAAGPAVEQAVLLERSGRPGYMHLSLAAADRLGAERGLFLDLAAGTAPAPARPAVDRGATGPGPPAGAKEPAPARRDPPAGAGGRGRVLRHQQSVWIDCFLGEAALPAAVDGPRRPSDAQECPPQDRPAHPPAAQSAAPPCSAAAADPRAAPEPVTPAGEQGTGAG